MSEPSSLKNLGAGFRQYFEIVPAANEELRRDVYRIRHEVYCEQLGYEPPNSNGEEKDEYDSQSLHCLMRSAQSTHSDNPDKKLVGCTRLILTKPDDRMALLPFEITCEEVIDRSVIDPQKLPRDAIAEVSRLAVRAVYRRRKGEQQTEGAVDFGNEGHARFPFIPLGLYLGTVALCVRNGIDIAFLLIEPRLLDHFGRIGFKIRPIGTPIEHRGLRVPAMIDVNELVHHMRTLLRPLYKEICSEIEQSLATQSIV